MKQRFTAILTLTFAAIMLQAQNPERMERMMERVKVQKIGFISDKLELTSGEATAFWPIYNEYEEERRQLMRSQRFARRGGDLSDDDAAKALDEYLNLRKEEYEIEKRYITRFKKAIPDHKIVKLLEAEREFKEELLKQVKERVRDRRPGMRN